MRRIFPNASAMPVPAAGPAHLPDEQHTMGQIIGAGVVALTGVAIGMTGPRSFSPIRWRRSLRS